jgi:hypothetical protein
LRRIENLFDERTEPQRLNEARQFRHVIRQNYVMPTTRPKRMQTRKSVVKELPRTWIDIGGSHIPSQSARFARIQLRGLAGRRFEIPGADPPTIGQLILQGHAVVRDDSTENRFACGDGCRLLSPDALAFRAVTPRSKFRTTFHFGTPACRQNPK